MLVHDATIELVVFAAPSPKRIGIPIHLRELLPRERDDAAKVSWAFAIAVPHARNVHGAMMRHSRVPRVQAVLRSRKRTNNKDTHTYMQPDVLSETDASAIHKRRSTVLTTYCRQQVDVVENVHVVVRASHVEACVEQLAAIELAAVQRLLEDKEVERGTTERRERDRERAKERQSIGRSYSIRAFGRLAGRAAAPSQPAYGVHWLTLVRFLPRCSTVAA